MRDGAAYARAARGRRRPLRPLRRDAVPAAGDSIEHTLLLTLAALILFVIANTFPFLTFELEGNADTSTLLTGVGVCTSRACGRSPCSCC